MQSLTDFFESNRLLASAAVVAALVVLLIVVFVLYRLLFGRRLRAAANGRTRQPRLGIVDAYDLDRQRQLVLVRRDNVEHLVMIGGPTDLLIESSIVRNQAAGSPREKDGPGPLIGTVAAANAIPASVAPPALAPAAPTAIAVPTPTPSLPPVAARGEAGPGRVEPTRADGVQGRTEPAIGSPMPSPLPDRAAPPRPPRPVAVPDPAAPPSATDLPPQPMRPAPPRPAGLPPRPAPASTPSSFPGDGGPPPGSAPAAPDRAAIPRPPLPPRPPSARPPLPPRPSLASSQPPRPARPTPTPRSEQRDDRPGQQPDPALGPAGGLGTGLDAAPIVEALAGGRIAPESAPVQPTAPQPTAPPPTAPPPTASPPATPQPMLPPPGRNIEALESLEEEMAKLLGRPTPRRDG